MNQRVCTDCKTIFFYYCRSIWPLLPLFYCWNKNGVSK